MSDIRNLVVGCDGTWNTPEDPESRTNVARILNACLSKNHVVHYEEGVGTAYAEALTGGIIGDNIDRQIVGGYYFLSRQFQDPTWARAANRVFIFGFSRGAYAARRLAALISFSGLPVLEEDYDKGWQAYLDQDGDFVADQKAAGRFFDIPIEVLGVWDTVKTTLDADLADKKLPDNVIAGYHAMAIDEKRSTFPVLKWHENNRTRQVWFPGVHANVGGGYPTTGLSNISLRWMIEWAYKHNLGFKNAALKKIKGDPDGKLNESYDGKWKLLGKKVRAVSKQALVHQSVKTRKNYQPLNVPSTVTYVKR
jgi:uncharacterized protein (DUF2235 family)